MEKYCRSCGSELKPGAKFCPECGEGITQDAPQQQAQSVNPPQRQGAQQNMPRYPYAVPNQAKQSAQPVYQQPYPAQNQPPFPYPQQNQSQPKKKSPALRIIAILLVVVILAGVGVTGFVYPGFFMPKHKVYQAQILLPEPTVEEAILDNTAMVTFSYYMAARGAFDMACNIDPETADDEELSNGQKYLEKAAQLFRTAEQLAALTEEAADVYIRSAKPSSPTVLTTNASYINPIAHSPGKVNAITALPYAADPGSREWAEAITYLYDHEAGTSYKKLGEMLGKDAKYALAAVTQASAIIEGDAYSSLSGKYSTALNTAKALRAAGAVAGAGLAVTVVATGGAAAAATTSAAKVIAAAKGAIAVGGATCSSVNAVIDVADAAVSITVGDENNEYIEAIEQTRTDFAPVATTFAIAKLAVSLPDMIKMGMDIKANGWSSFAPDKQDLTKAKSFLYISGLYNMGKKLFGGDSKTLTGVKPEDTPDGTKLTITTTEVGTDDKSKDNIRKVLDETGCSSDMKQLFNKAFDEADTGSVSPDPVTDDTYVPMPDDLSNQYLYDVYTVERDGFDINAYIDNLRSVLYEIAAMQDATEAPTDEPADPTEEETEEPSIPEPSAYDISGDDRDVMEKVAGTYVGKGTWHNTATGSSDTSQDIYHIRFDGEKLIRADDTEQTVIRFNTVERRGFWENTASDGTVLSYHELTFRISGSTVTLREDATLTRSDWNYVFEGTKVSEDPYYTPEGFDD